MEEKYKVCGVCKENKPRSNFPLRIGDRGYINYSCKTCRNTYERRLYMRNKLKSKQLCLDLVKEWPHLFCGICLRQINNPKKRLGVLCSTCRNTSRAMNAINYRLNTGKYAFN